MKKEDYSSKNPIPEKDLEDFYKTISALAKKTFGTDSEGDCPVEIELTDRSRCERLHFVNMPYPDWNKTNIKRIEKRFKVANLNLSVANEQRRLVEREMDEVFNIARDKK